MPRLYGAFFGLIFPSILKEVLQKGFAFLLQTPRLQFDVLVLDGMAVKRPDASHGPCDGIHGTAHDARDTGVENGACAHGTGLQGHVEGTVLQSPVSQSGAGVADDVDLGVTEGGLHDLTGVSPPRDNLARGVLNKDGAYRHVPILSGSVSLLQSDTHEGLIGGRKGITHRIASKSVNRMARQVKTAEDAARTVKRIKPGLFNPCIRVPRSTGAS